MYVRSEFGVFNKVAKEVDGWYILEDGNGVKKDSVEVADTPQELLKDMDLVFVKEWNTYENVFENGRKKYCYMDNKRHYIGEDIHIIKILTLNTKGDYIKQWEVE